VKQFQEKYNLSVNGDLDSIKREAGRGVLVLNVNKKGFIFY
jgi:hypothetical protein